MSDVVSVVPEDMLTDTNRFAPLSPHSSQVSAEVVDWGVVELPEFDAVVVPSDMSDFYQPILATQPPGIPGIYGKCGPVGCRVTGVRRRLYHRVGYATGCEPVCATQLAGVVGVALVIGATVT